MNCGDAETHLRPHIGRYERRSLILGTLVDPCVIMRLPGISASPAYFPFNLWHNRDSIIASSEHIYTHYRLKKRCIPCSHEHEDAPIMLSWTLESHHLLRAPLSYTIRGIRSVSGYLDNLISHADESVEAGGGKTALPQNGKVQMRLLAWAIAQCLLHHHPAEGVVIYNLWLHFVRWIWCSGMTLQTEVHAVLRDIRCCRGTASRCHRSDINRPGLCSIWHLSAGARCSICRVRDPPVGVALFFYM